MYELKKIRVANEPTVEDVIKQLQLEDPKAKLCITGSSQVFIHVAKRTEANQRPLVNLDCEDLHDWYETDDKIEVPGFNRYIESLDEKKETLRNLAIELVKTKEDPSSKKEEMISLMQIIWENL